MSQSDAFQVFMKEVHRRAKDFKRAMDAMLLSMSTTSPETRLAAANSLIQAAQSLCEILPLEDRPNWLEPIHVSSIQYSVEASDDRAATLIAEIMKYYSSVRPSRVLPEASADSPFKFDEYFEHARSQEQIAELFDAHLHAISEIIDSNEIESVTVLNALIQLVATLKANRDASYAAIKQSVYLARYVQNVVLVGLKKVPGLGILVEAAEKTLKETESGIDRLEKDMNLQLKNSLKQRLPRIEQASEIIEHEILALPSPSQRP